MAERAGRAYYRLKQADAEITLALSTDGQPPLDPKSNESANLTDDTRCLEADREATAALAQTVKLSDVSAADFDAVFYPCAHGPFWGLADDKKSIGLIESFLAAGEPVALVCHASGVLRHVNIPVGRPLVEGKKVTGFTDSEEEAVGLTDIVPFLVEDELKAQGGIYSQGPDWSSYVLQDGLLITGQNLGSSSAAAWALMDLLKAEKVAA